MTKVLLEGLGAGVISGLLAGLVAYLLLRKTQRNEAEVRATDRREEAEARKMERREAAARSLIPAIRNTVDTATRGDAAMEGANTLFELRNQVALAEGPLRGTAALEEVRKIYEALDELRRWVRDAPGETKRDLNDPHSATRIGWNQHGDGLNRWADRLVQLPHSS